jgi:MFS family permease
MRYWPLFVFWCLWFLNYSTRAVFSPLLPVIEDSLALSHGQAGGLLTSLSTGYGISLLMTGRYASFWGYKKTVVGGFIAIAAVLFLFQWAQSYVAVHILCFLSGVALGAYLPSMIPIITDTYDRRHWGKAIGLHDCAASFALFTTPLFVAFSLHFFSWKGLLVLPAAASLLLPIYFWKIAVEPRQEPAEQKTPYRALFRNRGLWVVGLLWIVANGSCNGIFAILPLYLIKERGFGFDHANTLIGVSRAGGIFATILFGFLCDRYGYRNILKVSLLGAGLGGIGLALIDQPLLFLFTLIFQAILGLGFFPAAFAAVARLTSGGERAMATGLAVALGTIFGAGGAPLIMGTIADHYSFRVGILAFSLLTTFAAPLIALLREPVLAAPV